MSPLLAAEAVLHLPTVWQLIVSVLMATVTASLIWAAIFWRAIQKKQVSVNSVMVLMALEGVFLAIALWLIGWRPKSQLKVQRLHRVLLDHCRPGNRVMAGRDRDLHGIGEEAGANPSASVRHRSIENDQALLRPRVRTVVKPS